MLQEKWFVTTKYEADNEQNNLRPHMREAYASKERMLRKQVSLAVKRMEANEPLGSALDYMIQREIGAAKKEQRAPVFDSPFMYDECKCYALRALSCPFVPFRALRRCSERKKVNRT